MSWKCAKRGLTSKSQSAGQVFPPGRHGDATTEWLLCQTVNFKNCNSYRLHFYVVRERVVVVCKWWLPTDAEAGLLVMTKSLRSHTHPHTPDTVAHVWPCSRVCVLTPSLLRDTLNWQLSPNDDDTLKHTPRHYDDALAHTQSEHF